MRICSFQPLVRQALLARSKLEMAVVDPRPFTTGPLSTSHLTWSSIRTFRGVFQPQPIQTVWVLSAFTASVNAGRQYSCFPHSQSIPHLLSFYPAPSIEPTLPAKRLLPADNSGVGQRSLFDLPRESCPRAKSRRMAGLARGIHRLRFGFTIYRRNREVLLAVTSLPDHPLKGW